MLYKAINSFFFLTSAASVFIFFTLPPAYSQNKEAFTAFFVLKGSVKFAEGIPIDAVELELKKNGKLVSQIITPRNGKYNIQIPIDTLNPKSEYLLFITKDGFIPKTITISTYIEKDEFNQNSFERYDFDLEIVMLVNKASDILVEKPSGKIHWNYNEHIFSFDQIFAKIIQKEEKTKKDSSIILKEFADKKKKEGDSIALAEQKSKEEAENILKKNTDAMRQELLSKHIQDSIDALSTHAEEKKTEDINQNMKPVSPEDVDQNAFDGTGAYTINAAKTYLKTAQEKMHKKQAANLSAKYETNNVLTSLLNTLDEYDKKMKKQ